VLHLNQEDSKLSNTYQQKTQIGGNVLLSLLTGLLKVKTGLNALMRPKSYPSAYPDI